MKNKQFIVLSIIVISFIISLFAILLSIQYDKIYSDDNFSVNKFFTSGSFTLPHLPDFARNYQYIDYIASNFSLPKEVTVQVLDREKIQPFWHSPLYYCLAASLLTIAKFLNINELLALQIFSAFLIMLTNICFYFLLRKLTKNEKLRIYALALFCFLPTHLFISLFIGSDPLYYLFLILSIYCLVKFNINPSKKNAVLLGIALAFALFSRIAAVILIGALVYASVGVVSFGYIYGFWQHEYPLTANKYRNKALAISFNVAAVWPIGLLAQQRAAHFKHPPIWNISAAHSERLTEAAVAKHEMELYAHLSRDIGHG